jgi:hypothetical protein
LASWLLLTKIVFGLYMQIAVIVAMAAQGCQSLLPPVNFEEVRRL